MFSARSILAYSVHSALKSLVTAHYQPVQVVDLECMLHKLLLTKQHAFEGCVHYNFGSTICTCNNRQDRTMLFVIQIKCSVA